MNLWENCVREISERKICQSVIRFQQQWGGGCTFTHTAGEKRSALFILMMSMVLQQQDLSCEGVKDWKKKYVDAYTQTIFAFSSPYRLLLSAQIMNEKLSATYGPHGLQISPSETSKREKKIAAKSTERDRVSNANLAVFSLFFSCFSEWKKKTSPFRVK